MSFFKEELRKLEGSKAVCCLICLDIKYHRSVEALIGVILCLLIKTISGGVVHCIKGYNIVTLIL